MNEKMWLEAAAAPKRRAVRVSMDVTAVDRREAYCLLVDDSYICMMLWHGRHGG